MSEPAASARRRDPFLSASLWCAPGHAGPSTACAWGCSAPAVQELPWEPLLTNEEVQTAQGYYGSGARLRRVAAKLLAGQPITVGGGGWEGG